MKHKTCRVLLPLIAALILAAACIGKQESVGAQEPAVEQAGEPSTDAIASSPIDAGPAILNTGPEKRTGLVMLPANAIEHYRGEYLAGPVVLRVYYAEPAIAVPEDWPTMRCGSLPLRIENLDDETYYVYSLEDWSVVFEIPPEFEQACPFIERFVQRLRYFQSVTDSAIVSFPAIVELPAGI